MLLSTLVLCAVLSVEDKPMLAQPGAAPPRDATPVASALPSLREDAARAYAAHVEREYRASLEAAESMRAAIRAFCAAPSEPMLARARETWTAAREIYGRTEVFRFGNGPIDTRQGGIETLINAWPLDEAYIDFVDGDSGGAFQAGGIVGNPEKYPSLGRAVLVLHNQRGGETHVCTGWHAIEFMLWGQDRSERGPGERSFRDFVDGEREHADRRREYLLEVTDLLCEHLTKLVDAWKPGAENYRKRFEVGGDASIRSMITGPALLVGFEMAGERLAVPYETRDQEEEHSCFSDTTHVDFRANIRGVDAVLRGAGGPGLIAVVRGVDAGVAEELERTLAAAFAAVDAMPVPFDAGIRAADGTPERAAMKLAIETLEALGEAIGRAGRAFGWALPTEPQG